MYTFSSIIYIFLSEKGVYRISRVLNTLLKNKVEKFKLNILCYYEIIYKIFDST